MVCLSWSEGSQGSHIPSPHQEVEAQLQVVVRKRWHRFHKRNGTKIVSDIWRDKAGLANQGAALADSGRVIAFLIAWQISRQSLQFVLALAGFTRGTLSASKSPPKYQHREQPSAR